MSDNTNKNLILLVEDEEDNIGLIGEMLDEEGFSFIVARNVDEAMSLYPRAQAIVMDGQIPGADPHTVGLVRYIRNNGFTGPIIANSASSKIGGELVDAGCSHMLNKLQLYPELPKLLRSLGL
ncbi:MAG TPA: response regulator [Candidatus Gracilibacteria bacterium]|nr:response regulator [Candidatus Gracilibacteria bacterium]